VYPIASKSVFATAHLRVTYWAAPAKLKQSGMTADPSIALKSMPIIVALDLTLEQAAFPMMCWRYQHRTARHSGFIR
jgi:hypothetical protein